MARIEPVVKIDTEKKKAYVTTTMFRVSFPQVFEPKSRKEGQEAKYTMTMMFPKNSDLKWLKDVVAKVKKLNFGDKEIKNFKHPIKDGDDMEHEANHGMYIVRCSTNKNRRPQVIDKNKNPITDPEDLYAGCWARATLTVAAYSVDGSKGVTCYLSNIQKLKDDDKLGGTPDADVQFSEVEMDEDDRSNYESEENDEFAEL